MINQQQLTFLEQGTLVEISGSAGRDGWLQFAALLEPTQLEPFDTTAAGQALANATPPAWTSMPLSARLGERVTPAVTGPEIVRQCGWTTSSTSNTPGRTGLEVRCAARLAGGATDETGGYGYSQYTWRQAAERLGVDPASGPSDDPLVYLFESDRADGSGSVVVLDATSAEPYLVARLNPATR